MNRATTATTARASSVSLLLFVVLIGLGVAVAYVAYSPGALLGSAAIFALGLMVAWTVASAVKIATA